MTCVFGRKEASLDDDNDFMLFHYYDDKRTIGLVVAISNNTGQTTEILCYHYHVRTILNKRAY